jgi:prophage regulatory protein
MDAQKDFGTDAVEGGSFAAAASAPLVTDVTGPDNPVAARHLESETPGYRSPPTDRPVASAVPGELAAEVSQAAAALVERLLAQLCGHIYSPRIRLLDIDQLGDTTGLAPSTIYQLVAEGHFPKPIKIGRQNKWRESTLITWLDRREEGIRTGQERR